MEKAIEKMFLLNRKSWNMPTEYTSVLMATIGM